MHLVVLYEDNHLLVVNKPSGLPTMGVAEGEPSMWLLAKEYLREKYAKPGNVYLGVVSRVDTPVTGVLIFARTSKAAARLSEQFREGTVDKTYWAVVEKAPQPPRGKCKDTLVKADRQRKVRVVKPGEAPPEEGQLAVLEYRTVRKLAHGALIEVQLLTGRKHQIRVQMASRGWPIVGDKKYGAETIFSGGIALHARRLVLSHPITKDPLEIVAPIPGSWEVLGVDP
jgi:23S rRNA pseudouridine1911/1915/1917 synthase